MPITKEMELNRQTKLGDLSPPARIAPIVALGVAALGLGLFVLARSHGESATAPRATPTTAVVPSVTRHSAAHPAPTPAAPPDGRQLPVNVTAALGTGSPVVVSLWAPNVKLDQLALAEAEAGAQSAGAAFTSVDVSTPDVNGLAARYSVLHDPSVLVLDSSGNLLVKLDGFADKDTVAQAAAGGQP
jgi:hypothetical protein